MATTMKGWQYTTNGALEKVLKFDPSIPGPTTSSLAKNHLLIRVLTASINPTDYKVPQAGLVGSFLIKPPAIPGLDFCGRVAGVHPSISEFKEGQLVFGCLGVQARYGALGELTIVPKEKCVLLPEGVEVDQAATLGIAALTAYQCLSKEVVKPGSKVFINGGSGGTGTFGIQIAKILGADVTVSCSGRSAELCKNLGAVEILDYTKVDVIAELKKKGQVFDLVVDNVARPLDLYERSHEFLKPGGAFKQVGIADVSLTGGTSVMRRILKPAFLGGGRRPYSFVGVTSRKKDLEQLGQWVAEGKLKPVIDHFFEWEETPKAYEELRLGRTQGKIIVHVGKQ